MASLSQWTWVCVNSGSWWWTGRPGGLQFMGSQRVRHNWATELNWTELKTNRLPVFLQKGWVYFRSLENCSVGIDTILAICKSLQSKARRGEKKVWRDKVNRVYFFLSLWLFISWVFGREQGESFFFLLGSDIVSRHENFSADLLTLPFVC